MEVKIDNKVVVWLKDNFEEKRLTKLDNFFPVLFNLNIEQILEVEKLLSKYDLKITKLSELKLILWGPTFIDTKIKNCVDTERLKKDLLVLLSSNENVEELVIPEVNPEDILSALEKEEVQVEFLDDETLLKYEELSSKMKELLIFLNLTNIDESYVFKNLLKLIAKDFKNENQILFYSLTFKQITDNITLKGILDVITNEEHLSLRVKK